MKKYILAMISVAAVGALIQIGCSGPGGSILPVTPALGTLAVYGGDTPNCTNVVSFVVTITGMTLTPQSGQSPVSVMPGGSTVTVDFASLMDFNTIFSLSTATPGTYNALGITLANPQLTYMDTSTSPATLKTITPTMSSLSVNVSLSPALTITSNAATALQLDFNLVNSLSAGPNNQFTVTPTFTASQASASGSNGFAEFTDLSGLVQSVVNNSTNSAFVGNFTVSSPNAPSFSVNVTSSTVFVGIAALSSLTAGTFAEMDAFLDSNGNIVANTVVVEAQENQASGEAAFSGLVTSVTPTSGNATQFTLLVETENPDLSSSVALFAPLTFSIGPSSTTFGLVAQAADFANFTFGPPNLAAGQRLVVHGTLPGGSGAAQSAVARSIFLPPQSILGTLSTNPSTPLSIANNGVDGGFTLVPCSPLFQPAQITVLASQPTNYFGISALSDLNTPGAHFLLVSGPLFYEQTNTIYSVESWTVPASVQEATQVHQLSDP